ncbi:MAG: transporter [Blastocatellia bacterium]|nr:transporter [Blastocatellia bacterium]
MVMIIKQPGKTPNFITKSFFAKLFVTLFIVFSFCFSANAQQRPLLTEDVDIIEPGSVRTQIGFELLQKQKFGISGLEGDLSRLGVIDMAIGLSPNVQFEIEGTLRQYLSIDKFGPSQIPLNISTNSLSTSDVGDFTLATKIKLRNETARTPSLGFRFGVQLPNTNQAKGLGTNSTNFFATVLAGKKLLSNRLNLFGNLGLAILNAPTQQFSQNDVMLYGIAGIYKFNKRINLVGEVNGRYSFRKAPVGTEDISEARFGFQLFAGGLRFDLAGVKGMTDFSPNSGIVFGVTKDIKALFNPVR